MGGWIPGTPVAVVAVIGLVDAGFVGQLVTDLLGLAGVITATAGCADREVTTDAFDDDGDSAGGRTFAAVTI